MPKINIDELIEPIEVTVNGKIYTFEDISSETTKKMIAIGNSAQEVEDTEPLVDILAEILGADRKEIAKLGMRKRLGLITNIMNIVNSEVESKNVPKVAAKK